MIATLLDFGLDEKEAKHYIALLKYGTATATEIATTMKCARSTTHYILENLKTKGFITSNLRNKTTYFTAEGPEKLELNLKKEENELRRKENLLEKNMYKLKQIQSPHVKLPKVKYYTGEKGLEEILYKFATQNKNSKLRHMGSFRMFNEKHKEIMQKYFSKATFRFGYYLKPSAFKSPSSTTDPTFPHETRFFLDDKIKPNTVIRIGEKAMCFLTEKENQPIALLINDPEIIEMYINIFDDIWNKTPAC